MKSLSKGPSPLVTVKMPDELRYALDRAAEHCGVSRSRFVRVAITHALDNLDEFFPEESGAA